MEKIASFCVDHELLDPGVYVSRRDRVGDGCVTTFDVRMTKPNAEPAMDTAAVHAIEHLGATWLRNHPEWGPKTLYFGPMGCRTGFYLLLAGEYESADVAGMLRELFAWIAAYEGEIPGASPKDCGNWLDLNLPMAKWEAARYLERCLDVLDESHMVYAAANEGGAL
jgi:S-ribosylhomocysteine lyase